ncbi:unnamed protein product [Schistosoma margrebowiei]|uniref:Uncharacterized protein n=1 Tax=Schistosoma margrebowiei TaxID=48269 RepID=A0A183MT50_9TREM|nr:unnamed protein product [Schistosoma margrebowiei]
MSYSLPTYIERPDNVGDREGQSNSNENEEIQFAVPGISEIHWTKTGQQRLNTGEMLLYSGHEDENALHNQRVALMLSKVTRNALVG